MNSDPFRTQRDVGSAAVAELAAAGFADAEEIGRGGFGIVFRCNQVALDRTVAVKILTAELPDDRERFLREQRAMGRMTGHPNIVAVLEVGETASYPYLVMPYHRHGSLDERIRRLGRLPLEEVLRIGVKVAGALETAHRLEIVHRDIKPGNILLTEYGQPAVCDFGIAHIAGGFKTAAGTYTGSPAFTAPEILSGDPPSTASDVYALGATLFAALTGHAAYERQSGEQVVVQFLRIATEPVPDLRDGGMPDDIARLVEAAMAREPGDRPSAAGLGEQLQRIQAAHGFAMDEIPLPSDQHAPPHAHELTRGHRGNIPLELTSFVGRRAELAEARNLLSTSRLVTVAGIGGVGKTRLALRAATEMRPDFPDGAWFVELGEIRDPTLVTNAVAGAIGLRDESGRSLLEVLIEFLFPRTVLIILDNCEQLVDDAAKLADALLHACPDLRILATSRERLGIGGEAVLKLSPLAFPDADREPTLRGLSGYDGIALFVQRAAAALPGFELTKDNAETVARICSRVEGIPLAIELAAARLRVMSARQILERLSDRYALLNRGSRDAPTRQQTLEWCVDWSYDLCTPAEQRLWARLSVFAGSFELVAAEEICSGGISAADMLDLLTSLVDKSILLHTQTDSTVRFRFLDTLRDYGRERIEHSGEYLELRRRHLEFYRRLVADAAAEWFSARQVYWIQRLDAEIHNVREASEFALTDSPRIAAGIAGGLWLYAIARGLLGEFSLRLDRALTASPSEPSVDRIQALYAATIIAGMQGNSEVATARAGEARSLVEGMDDRRAQGLVAIADGFAASVGGDAAGALARSEDALAATEEPMVRFAAMLLKGWALEFRGEIERALIWQEKALAVAESLGEMVFRSYALWAIGIGWWRNGKPDRAQQLLRQGLELAHRINDPRTGASCLEALAWVAGARSDSERAVILMAAAEELASWQGASPAIFPDLMPFHDEYQRRAHQGLEAEQFDTARRRGVAMDFDEAVAYALDGA
jgi:predicted ATPase